MRILAFLLLMLAALSANALPSVEDIEHAVHRGDYSAAESMVREVIAAKPENAKAHYILAELLAHEGKIAEAKSQAGTARTLDPAVHFTNPDRFREFLAELDGKTVKRAGTSAAPRAAEPRKAEENSSGGSTGVWILLLLGAGAVFLFLRRRPNMSPGFRNAYPDANPNAPGGMPGAQGYPGYPMGTPPSGVGNSVMAGLGGVAAGMVAEHLIEEALDHRHRRDDAGTFIEHPSSSGETVEDRPIDFGNGNDWGGDAAGGDSGGGFDSGSGGDWS